MSGPPAEKEIKCSELFQLLAKERPNDRPFEVVDFPRKDDTGKPICQLAMWSLKEREIIAARSEATRKAREFIKEKVAKDEYVGGYDQVMNDISSTEMLVQCCRDPENRAIPFFPHGKAVREFLTSDEMSVLCVKYASVQHRLGPIVATMSDEEYEAWIETLGRGGSEVPLSSLSWELRTTLLMRTAKELWTSRTGKSSAGSPPEEPTSEPPENVV